MPDAVREYVFFFFSSRRRHTRLTCDWSSDVWSSDLACKGRVDASEQIILLKGLAQVTKNAGRSRALANAVVRVRRDQDGWNAFSGHRQALIKLEPSQIGRASCRERGEMSVVGGSL